MHSTPALHSHCTLLQNVIALEARKYIYIYTLLPCHKDARIGAARAAARGGVKKGLYPISSI